MKGINQTYKLTDVTLLRNTQSVDPRNDGWWVSHIPGLELQRGIRIGPETALAMLRQWRRVDGARGLGELGSTPAQRR